MNIKQHGNLHDVLDYRELIKSQANQVTGTSANNFGAKKVAASRKSKLAAKNVSKNNKPKGLKRIIT